MLREPEAVRARTRAGPGPPRTTRRTASASQPGTCSAACGTARGCPDASDGRCHPGRSWRTRPGPSARAGARPAPGGMASRPPPDRSATPPPRQRTDGIHDRPVQRRIGPRAVPSSLAGVRRQLRHSPSASGRGAPMPRCRNARIRPVCERSRASRCTASDAVRRSTGGGGAALSSTGPRALSDVEPDTAGRDDRYNRQCPHGKADHLPSAEYEAGYGLTDRNPRAEVKICRIHQPRSDSLDAAGGARGHARRPHNDPKLHAG